MLKPITKKFNKHCNKCSYRANSKDKINQRLRRLTNLEEEIFCQYLTDELSFLKIDKESDCPTYLEYLMGVKPIK